MSDRPNIIIFNPDQMRWDVMGHMGNPAAQTPTLDQAVKEDFISFDHAFVQNPICTPSRCSFLSGLYPHVFGHRTISFMQYPHEPNFLRTLKNNGYYVWMNDRNDFLPAQNDGFYEAYCDEFYIPNDLVPLPSPVNKNFRGDERDSDYYSFFIGEVGTDVQGRYYDADASSVNAFVEAIEEHSNSPDKPFCGFLGLFNPHPPYLCEEPYFSAIDRSQVTKPKELNDDTLKPKMIRGLRRLYKLHDWDEEKFKELRAVYLGMVMKVDNYFAKVIRALKKNNMYDNTLIIFMSDHGDFTGDYKLVEKTQNTFEDCLVRVPLLIKPPASDVNKKAGIYHQLVEMLDLYATILDYAEIDIEETNFSRSLRPFIEGKADQHRDFVFSEGGHLPGETHCNSAGKNPDKSNYYYPRFVMQSSDAVLKGTMIRNHRFKYVYRPHELDELYDLIADPDEVNNLIKSEKIEDIVRGFRQELLYWYQQTCDFVPLKPDLRMNETMRKSREKMRRQI